MLGPDAWGQSSQSNHNKARSEGPVRRVDWNIGESPAAKVRPEITEEVPLTTTSEVIYRPAR
ncbi:MAG: hypothetical protein KW802_03000 [Candidatus Doudnabacteria bacterium]|nr:hypothetical protein [Candidatus Doudnabacteria bacterium]